MMVGKAGSLNQMVSSLKGFSPRNGLNKEYCGGGWGCDQRRF